MRTQESVLAIFTPLLKMMVSDASALNISLKQRGQDNVLQVTCTKSGRGALIGKEGRNARSLRVILDAISVQTGLRFTLNIIETDDGFVREPLQST